MAMVRKDGKLPANARVDVDYTGKKPKISFSYPKLPATAKDKRKGKKWSTTKKDAVDQNAIGPHTYILILIFAAIGLIFYLNSYDYGSYPSDCEVVLDKYSSNYTIIDYINNDSEDYNYSSIRGADFYCDGNTTHYKTWFNTAPSSFRLGLPGFYYKHANSIWSGIWPGIRVLLGVILALYFLGKLNILITKWLVTKRWYQRWLPEHNAKKKNKKYQKFTIKDFDDDLPFVEVPNFKNISIEYKTFGDFSKQLKKIKIREHRYNEYDTKKKKIGKLKVEILKWTARFYFDKIPKDGYMEVIYY